MQETIRRQQDASEILIGWTQFGILATFAALYTLAPKTFAEDANFEPVPWALAIYSLFTVVRLVLAHARRIPYWMLSVSVVVDMALLLGLTVNVL